MKSDAIFSDDRVYRYVLTRQLHRDDQIILDRTVMFICLNPSTADETHDDPTVRRCISFAKSWGGSRLIVCNIFAYRGTNPRDLYGVADPVGPDNDHWIEWMLDRAHIIVAAWGGHGQHLHRGVKVSRLLPSGTLCLGRTLGAEPKHPLYLAANTPLEPYL